MWKKGCSWCDQLYIVVCLFHTFANLLELPSPPLSLAEADDSTDDADNNHCLGKPTTFTCDWNLEPLSGFGLTPPWLQVPPYLLHSVRARTSTSNLESKQARKSLPIVKNLCTCHPNIKYTYLWMKSFLLKVQRLQRLGDHKQIALPATRGHQRVTTPLFTECKELNLSKSIKFLTKLHFNFIFPPPFCFSDIPYIVQFWYTTILFTPVEVHQQVRKFTTR